MEAFTAQYLLKTPDISLPSSAWTEISQSMINAFADATQDQQFIHVDPERSRRETPFGGTIAHGFLIMSLLTRLMEESCPKVEGSTLMLNYGIDKLRFLTPVPAGSRVRAHFRVRDSQLKRSDQLLIRYAVEIELERHAKPALVAEWLALAQLAHPVESL